MCENSVENNRQRIREIFFEAYRKKTPRERSYYLDQVCGSDSELRTELESLLEAHDRAGSILDAPPLAPEMTFDDTSIMESPGTVIGRYTLLEKIGEGGMAVVYMAEQEQPVRRQVALKIIKLGMDTKQVIARFEAERQALAMMDHPNIAKVLDAGATETGRPYFVMDLAKGIPVTKYCDENNLSTDERLKLFTQVCNAIQHAHQKGIIHRDIKPTNVLVQVQDGVPVPKVIDFGIAKAINQKLTEKTLFTHFQQLVGTPEYMSPEQAEWGATDIDTRTDIYSLGVLLYELLTGVTPFDAQQLREAGYSRMLEIIRQEEPIKPSTKLDTVGKTLPDIAAHRKSNPQVLKKLLHGDLDWIVMKALDKDRTRRYETAAEFGMDINRHLDNEPVTAAGPGVAYKIRKFVRRHKMGVAAGALVVTALLAGTLGTTIGFVRASTQRERAEANFQKAYDAVDEMAEMAQWRISGETVKSTNAQLQRKLILRAQEYYQEFLAENEDDPALRERMGRAYRYLGDLHVLLDSHQLGEGAYRQSIEVFEKLMRESPESVGLREETAASYYGLSFALTAENREEDSRLAYKAATALAGASTSVFQFGPRTNLGPQVNSRYGDSGPCISADGLSLYFFSNRPGGEGNYDLWVTTRQTTADAWTEPYNLGPNVNSRAYDGLPSVSADGLSLFFCSQRPGGQGSDDLWVSRRATTQSEWGLPIHLGETVNSPYMDAAPSISADGLTLYFESDRPGGLGGWDLWMTVRNSIEGDWSPPVNLGPGVNSPYLEQQIDLSDDGLVLVFGSNRYGSSGISTDLWAVTRPTINAAWGTPINLGPGINTPVAETCPNLSADNSILFFAGPDRPGGEGGWDLWQAPIMSVTVDEADKSEGEEKLREVK